MPKSEKYYTKIVRIFTGSVRFCEQSKFQATDIVKLMPLNDITLPCNMGNYVTVTLYLRLSKSFLHVTTWEWTLQSDMVRYCDEHSANAVWVVSSVPFKSRILSHQLITHLLLTLQSISSTNFQGRNGQEIWLRGLFPFKSTIKKWTALRGHGL